MQQNKQIQSGDTLLIEQDKYMYSALTKLPSKGDSFGGEVK